MPPRHASGCWSSALPPVGPAPSACTDCCRCLRICCGAGRKRRRAVPGSGRTGAPRRRCGAWWNCRCPGAAGRGRQIPGCSGWASGRRTGRPGAPSWRCGPAGPASPSMSGLSTMTPDVAEVAAPQETVGNSGAPVLRFEVWEGPLDLLLELARAQRVDLARLSVTALATQFAAVLDTAIARRAVPLSRLADWLVMAAWLLLLRSRLL